MTVAIHHVEEKENALNESYSDGESTQEIILAAQSPPSQPQVVPPLKKSGANLLKKVLKDVSAKQSQVPTTPATKSLSEDLFSPVTEFTPVRTTFKHFDSDHQCSTASVTTNTNVETVEIEVINLLKSIRPLSIPLQKQSVKSENIKAIKRLTEVMFNSNLAKNLSETLVEEILRVIKEVIMSTSDMKVKQLMLWSLSTQNLPLNLVDVNFEIVLDSAVKILSKTDDSVSCVSLALDVILHLFKQCPNQALKFNSKWLIDVLLCCLSSDPLTRDKTEQVLSLTVTRLIEDYSQIEEVMYEFFVDYADAFGKHLSERKIFAESSESVLNAAQQKYIIRIWSHLVLLCGKVLSKTEFFSQLLSIIETCFNNKTEWTTRKHCYEAWSRLIFNLSLDNKLSLKKLKLLVSPIKTCFECEVNCKVVKSCLLTWLKLISVLMDKGTFYEPEMFQECFINVLPLTCNALKNKDFSEVNAAIKHLLSMIVADEIVVVEDLNSILNQNFGFYSLPRTVVKSDQNIIDQYFSYFFNLSVTVIEEDTDTIVQLVQLKQTLLTEEEVRLVVEHAVSTNNEILSEFLWDNLPPENLTFDGIIHRLLKRGPTYKALSRLNQMNLLETHYTSIIRDSWDNGKKILDFINRSNVPLETMSYISSKLSQTFLNEMDLDSIEVLVLTCGFTNLELLKVLNDLIVTSHSNTNASLLIKLFKLFSLNLFAVSPSESFSAIPIVLKYCADSSNDDSMFSFGQVKRLKVVREELFSKFLLLKLNDCFVKKDNQNLLEELLYNCFIYADKTKLDQVIQLYNKFVNSDTFFENEKLIDILKNFKKRIKVIPVKSNLEKKEEAEPTSKNLLAKRLLMGIAQQNVSTPKEKTDSKESSSDENEETQDIGKVAILKRKYEAEKPGVTGVSKLETPVNNFKRPQYLNSILKSARPASSTKSNRRVSFQLEDNDDSKQSNCVSPTVFVQIEHNNKKQKLECDVEELNVNENMNVVELLAIQEKLLNDLTKVNELLKSKMPTEQKNSA